MTVCRVVGVLGLAATVSLGSVALTAGPAVAAPRPAGTSACASGPAATADATLAGALQVGTTARQRAAWSARSPAERQRLLDGFRTAVAPAACRAAAALVAKPTRPAGAAPWRDVIAGKAAPTTGGAPLRFSSTAPALARPAQLTGQDQDGDGLDDGLEGDIANAFTPLYAVSAGERPGTGFATFGDFVPQTVQQSFGSVPPFSYFRVQPLGVGVLNGTQVGVLRVDYLTLWNRDDGLDVGSSCAAGLGLTLGLVGLGASAILDGLAGHQLDNERSAALLAAPLAGGGYNPNPAAYSAYGYYTAAHEGTFTDQSAFITPSQPTPAGNHLLLAMSRAKHGTYIFNPDGLPLIPGSVIDAVFGTIDFLLADGEIDIDTASLYEAIADSVFFGCIIEHFQGQGATFAGTQVNVGEPSRPINGAGFIRDSQLNAKLSTPLWG